MVRGFLLRVGKYCGTVSSADVDAAVGHFFGVSRMRDRV